MTPHPDYYEIISFSRNHPDYNGWFATQNCRSQYVEVLLNLANTHCSENSLHKDLQRAEVRMSENDAQAMIAALNNFANPFQLNVDGLKSS